MRGAIPVEDTALRIDQPYPGLRPFERQESPVFFGRERQVDELLARLNNRHVLAVPGASGSGKSSLLKAGLLPALARGYLGEAGARWSIAELRPGSAAFERLAEALLRDPGFRRAWRPAEPKREAGPEAVALLAAALQRGARSLHGILAEAPLPEGTRLLLLIDQFEELFRYRSLEENLAVAFRSSDGLPRSQRSRTEAPHRTGSRRAPGEAAPGPAADPVAHRRPGNRPGPCRLGLVRTPSRPTSGNTTDGKPVRFHADPRLAAGQDRRLCRRRQAAEGQPGPGPADPRKPPPCPKSSGRFRADHGWHGGRCLHRRWRGA